jgi:hypothetical protein
LASQDRPLFRTHYPRACPDGMSLFSHVSGSWDTAIGTTLALHSKGSPPECRLHAPLEPCRNVRTRDALLRRTARRGRTPPGGTLHSSAASRRNTGGSPPPDGLPPGPGHRRDGIALKIAPEPADGSPHAAMVQRLVPEHRGRRVGADHEQVGRSPRARYSANSGVRLTSWHLAKATPWSLVSDAESRWLTDRQRRHEQRWRDHPSPSMGVFRLQEPDQLRQEVAAAALLGAAGSRGPPARRLSPELPREQTRSFPKARRR